MANLAEKHDEEQSAHLADAEISRILSTLQKAEFKRSETGNALPDQTFKPRSLIEIAETARQQDGAVIDDTDENGLPTLDGTSTGGTPEHIMGNDQLHEQPSVGGLDNQPQNTSGDLPAAEPSTSDLESLPATDVGEVADAELDSGAENGLNLDSPTSPFETAKMAYDRGYAEGVVAGQKAAEAELRSSIEAEFETKLDDKIGTFESVLTALTKPQTSDLNSLSSSLQAAVVRLAAARAGMAIDELPKLLLTRIEELADVAGKNVSAGIVFLHPEDCAVISPIMMERHCPVKIEADPQLYRGDIRIRFDGMDISDVADLRADWKISKQTTDRSFTDAELPQTNLSEVEQEFQKSDHLSEDLQVDPAKSNTTLSSPAYDENTNAPVENLDNIGDASASNSGGLMPLTTTGGEDAVTGQKTEEHEEASTPSSIDLMPLTTTGGEDAMTHEGTEGQEEASALNPSGLMPLTTTGGEDAVTHEGAEEQEEDSASNPSGLMPLTSKNVDE